LVAERGGIGSAKSVEDDIKIGDSELFTVRPSQLEEISRSAVEELRLLFFVKFEGHPAFMDGFQEVCDFGFAENRFHAFPVALLHHEVGEIDSFHLTGFQKRINLTGEFRFQLFLALEILQLFEGFIAYQQENGVAHLRHSLFYLSFYLFIGQLDG